MRISTFLFMPLFLLTAAASTQTRAGPDDFGLPRISPGGILAIGDIHGAQQIPRYSMRLVDQMAAQGTLVVGVELARDSESINCATPQAVLPASWALAAADGRTSTAVRDLLCHLRAMRDQRKIRIVYLEGSGRQRGFDTLAALRVVDALADAPGARALIVAGNYHMRNVDTSLAGSLRTRGFDVTTATISSPDRNARVWQCQKDGCGEKRANVNLCSGQAQDAPSGGRQAVSWNRIDNSPWDYCVTMPRLSASEPLAALPRAIAAATR